MAAVDIQKEFKEADDALALPHDADNEMLAVCENDNTQGQMEDILGPQAEFNEAEEEKKYYRRKRLGVIKNVVAASTGTMILYSVYMGLLQMQLILHYDMTYREVKYSNLGLENIDRKMLRGINLTPIFSLLYTSILIRFLGTKWMMFLASGVYAFFVSTNYWERYYTLVPSAAAIGVVIVPLWGSLGNYITRMAQQYYEYVNFQEEDAQEQKKLPKGACHRYIIIFQSVFNIIFNLSFIFAQLPMCLILNDYINDLSHVLFKVQNCGANISGMLPGLNTTVLKSLPQSMKLIIVESIFMGFAFLSMIIFLVLCGAAYRPTEEIDLRSIGYGNIFQLPFKHFRDYRLHLLCPFFFYSGLEVLFAITGLTVSYGVCALGLNKLWLLMMVYGLSTSCFSFLALLLLRLPRWVCLSGGAAVHLVLLVVLMVFSPTPKKEDQEVILLVISILWGLGSALNKTGVSIVLGIVYAEEKERLDFVYTIYHWFQAIAIFVVYLWSDMPMRAKLGILLATLLLACYCYWVMERRIAKNVRRRLPRIPRPRHKVKGYRYLEDGNSDESDSEKSEEDDENDVKEIDDEELLVNDFGVENMEAGRQDAGDLGVDSLRARKKRAENHHQREEEDIHVNECQKG
ncbi:protein unc-93 homolog B1 [Stigmatopora nigra]